MGGIKMAENIPMVDAEYDLVVVGGGGSGKSAALTAAQGGLSVALLEKLKETGGSSIYAEGTAAFESCE
jgi:fumarate reductase flavoprotein subunit